MSVSEVLAELDLLIGQAKPEERPSLALALSARMAALAAGMAVMTNGAEPKAAEEPEQWIKPEEAAAIAGVDRRTIYDWAVGKPWASRPTRHCLRIGGKGFRRWLASRAR